MPGAGARRARAGRASSTRTSSAPEGLVQSPYAGDGAPAAGTRGAGTEERKPPDTPGPVDTRADSASRRVRLGRAIAGAEPPVRSRGAAAGNASSIARSRRGSGDGTAANGAAVVRGPAGLRGTAGREAAGTGGSGSRERDTWRAASGVRDAAGDAGRAASADRSRLRAVGWSLSSAEAPRQRPSGASVRRRFAATGGLAPSRPSLSDPPCLPTVSKSNRCNSHWPEP